MRKLIAITALLLAAQGWTSGAFAADHRDGPGVRADPAADINDVFAWMGPDANRVYLVMTVFPFATAEARFSDSAQYVFHTASGPAFGQVDAAEVNLICTFDASQMIACRVGDTTTTVIGDASATAGLTSSDGRLRVFSGLRNDPFFFNLNGFQRTTRIVAGAASSLTFDPAGCPALDPATAQALVTQLQTEPDGSPATDEFTGANGLALVLSVDKSLLTANGPILAVWGSTNRASGTNCVGDANGDGSVHIDEIITAVNSALSGCDTAPARLLGLQVERMGRAAINTAVVDPFFAAEDEHGAVQNEYNASADPAQWAALFAARMAGNLAILDSLDTVCGNQLLSGAQPVAGRYDALAGVLADDRLYVNTASGACQQYLAVEGNAVGITNNDCGGRTPLYDTVDVSYSVLAIGQLTGVGDGIAQDSDGTASLTTFPFLNDPVAPAP
ncbi:MAG: DUF4331 family protein [bacterium]